MGSLPSRVGFAALAALLVIAVFLPQVAGWTSSNLAFELAGLNLAAMLTALLAVQQAATKDRAIMPPSFIFVFGSLLLFGPDVATLVAAAVALTPGFASPDRAYPRRQMVIDAAIAVLATQIAGLAYRSLTGTAIGFVWPWRALPIAAAVVGYHLTQGLLADILEPLLGRQPLNRSWPKSTLRGCPDLPGWRQHRRGSRRADRKPVVGNPAGRGRFALLRVRSVCRLRERARREAPPPRGRSTSSNRECPSSIAPAA